MTGLALKNIQRQPRLIQLGLIGAPDDLRQTYLPIFVKYAHRIQINSVYDPAWMCAKQAAQLLRSKATPSLLDLFHNNQIEALICLKSPWTPLTRLADHFNKNILFLGPTSIDIAAFPSSHPSSLSGSQFCCPGLTWRYQPAMLRLLELISTKLGIAQHIELTFPTGSTSLTQHPLVASLLDWAFVLLGRDLHCVDIEQASTGGCSKYVFQLRRKRSPHEPARLFIAQAQTLQPPAEFSAKIVCAQGEALINSPVDLSWTLHSGSWQTEVLHQERAAVEVLIDHYCRRIAGGLIPVPAGEDLCVVEKALSALDAVMTTHQPITFDSA